MPHRPCGRRLIGKSGCDDQCRSKSRCKREKYPVHVICPQANPAEFHRHNRINDVTNQKPIAAISPISRVCCRFVTGINSDSGRGRPLRAPKEKRDRPDRWDDGSAPPRNIKSGSAPARFCARASAREASTMFKRTRLTSLAAIAVLVLSGPASAMAATPDHPKKKVTHASKPVPKSVSKRTVHGPAPVQRPSAGPY